MIIGDRWNTQLHQRKGRIRREGFREEAAEDYMIVSAVFDINDKC